MRSLELSVKFSLKPQLIFFIRLTSSTINTQTIKRSFIIRKNDDQTNLI